MFSDPRHNIEQFGLASPMTVADLGTGSGHYALEAARAVRPMGKVFAVDLMREMLEKVKKDAQKQHLTNIDIIAGNIESLGGTKLREASVDAAIVSNVLFMIEDKKAFLLEVKRILKQGGKALCVDWTASFGNMGPHPDHVVYKDAAMKLWRDAGFTYEREISAGSHHYGMIFRKS